MLKWPCIVETDLFIILIVQWCPLGYSTFCLAGLLVYRNIYVDVCVMSNICIQSILAPCWYEFNGICCLSAISVAIIMVTYYVVMSLQPTEDWARTAKFYGCTIFKWVAATYVRCTILVLVMDARLIFPITFFDSHQTVYRCFDPMLCIDNQQSQRSSHCTRITSAFSRKHNEKIPENFSILFIFIAGLYIIPCHISLFHNRTALT